MQQKKMTNLEINRKIQDLMISHGYEYLSSSNPTQSTFQKAYAKISISFEMCVCHGGRISISDEHNNSWHRIEHECYDESLGITDTLSELLWEIENELIPEVDKRFSHMTFKLVKIDENGKETTNYFSTEDDAFSYLTEGKIKNENLHTFKEGVIDYPNSICHTRIKRIFKEAKYSWEKNKYYFDIEETSNNWKNSRKSTAEISIFEK